MRTKRQTNRTINKTIKQTMNFLQRKKRNAAIMRDFAAMGGNEKGAMNAAAVELGRKYKLSRNQIYKICKQQQ